jgi:hypothetical protein
VLADLTVVQNVGNFYPPFVEFFFFFNEFLLGSDDLIIEYSSDL